MEVKTVKSYGLAHNSYYLVSNGEAAVIDPRRDCTIYTEMAADDCVEIKYILETHRNEDYAVGSLELQNMTDAEIAHSNALPFKYGEHSFTDGDMLTVGRAKILVLHTPGHTNESVCYVVSADGVVQMVFTGDTLFAGSVGRTDLYGKDAHVEQAEKLYHSLHEKLLTLDDSVLVYPAHGAGSICGGGISGYEPTTIGYERKTNPYLQLDKHGFIEKSLNEVLMVPRYFKQIEQQNLNGPPLLSELSDPKPLTLQTFQKEMQEQSILVVDTRLPYAFAGSHIPDSLSLWLGGTSVYPGWLLDINQHIVFVLERPQDLPTVTERFRRLGFTNMRGYLCGGMNTWQEAGKAFRSFGTMTATELKAKLDEVLLLDVREPHEWPQDGYIEGAKLVNFANLPSKTSTLSKDKPLAVMCSVGNRTSTALSLLERAGFKTLFNVLGGMTAWTALGYSVTKKFTAGSQLP